MSERAGTARPGRFTAGQDGAPWLRDLRAQVRARLRAQHSTQAALAGYLGMSPKHLSQFLNGSVTGTPGLHGRVAEAVGLAIVIADTGREPVPLARDQRGVRSGRRKAAAP